jgi:hypothetical protein
MVIATGTTKHKNNRTIARVSRSTGCDVATIKQHFLFFSLRVEKQEMSQLVGAVQFAKCFFRPGWTRSLIRKPGK